MEQPEGQQITCVKGRLRENITFWQDVQKAPTPILDCIRSGYKLPLITEPPAHVPVNKLAAAEYIENLLVKP